MVPSDLLKTEKRIFQSANPSRIYVGTAVVCGTARGTPPQQSPVHGCSSTGAVWQADSVPLLPCALPTPSNVPAAAGAAAAPVATAVCTAAGPTAPAPSVAPGRAAPGSTCGKTGQRSRPTPICFPSRFQLLSAIGVIAGAAASAAA